MVMATILFDGVAYGMLLFVLACGLAVTLGLMNFVNLAHGAFAMAGGYVTVILMDRWGVPFLACLPLAFLVPAAIGLVLERTLYRHMYGRSHLDQVLFSIGLVFVAVAATDYFLAAVATVRANKARYAEADTRARQQRPRRPAYYDDQERLS